MTNQDKEPNQSAPKSNQIERFVFESTGERGDLRLAVKKIIIIEVTTFCFFFDDY